MKSAAGPTEAYPAQCETLRYRVAKGFELVADVGGPENGLAVLLLHGVGQTRHSWKDLAQRLANAGCRVTNVDQRGHGESDWAADGDYRLDAYISDLNTLLSWQPRPPILIGASLGGVVSLLLAGEGGCPAVSGLALVDIVPKFERTGSEAVLRFMRANPDGFASLAAAVAAVAEFLPHRSRPPTAAGLMKNLRQAENGRLYWHWDPRMIEARDRDQYSSDIACRLDGAARNIRVPTLLVRGSRSELVSMDSVRHFLDLIPDASFVDVKDAAHMVAGDMNDAFNQTIIDFIGRRIPA